MLSLLVAMAALATLPALVFRMADFLLTWASEATERWRVRAERCLGPSTP